MRAPGTSKHCLTNMAADEKAATIFLLNREEKESMKAVMD